MSTSFLITGATGKQGGSVISAILASPSFSPSTTKIYALTRSPTSASALRLVAKSPSISLISGDLDNIPAIFSSLPSPPTGVFSVQALGKKEVAQGNALIDSAVEAGVKTFVYASVERGGVERSDVNPTDVEHFRTKHEIEKHLKEKAEGTRGTMSYTILRPVFFLDNLQPGLFGRIVATAWRISLPANKKLQVIDTTDIGPFGAAALLEPENPSYHNKALSLAGDELTFEEANALFVERTGTPMPTTYEFLSRLILWLAGDAGAMFRWFGTEGFGVEIEKIRGMQAGKGMMSMGVGL